MEYRKSANLLVLLLLLGTGALQAAESGRIYRYVDNNGKTAFNSYIPADFVKNGYAILNHKGQLLEEFPPQLTREDRAALTAEQEQQRLQEEARNARKEADSILLRVYRTPEDIERKRDLNLAELDREIATKTTELGQLDAALTQLEQGSAEFVKRTQEREELDTELLTLTAKRVNAAYGFEEDIERLRYLQRSAKDTAAN